MAPHSIVLERFGGIASENGYEAVFELIGQRQSTRVKIVSSEDRAILQVSDREKDVVLDLDTETAVVSSISVGDQGVLWNVE